MISGFFFLIPSDLISLNALIYHPWVGPVFPPLVLILPLLVSEEESLMPFPLAIDHFSIKWQEQMPCSKKS